MQTKGAARQRGFFFALDSLLAIAILAAALIAIQFLSAQSAHKAPSELLLAKQADDAIASLDFGGDLASQNQSRMNSTLSTMLSGGAAFNLTVDYYNYSAGGFVRNGTIYAGVPDSAAKTMVRVQRAFVVVKNASVAAYGIATLELWP